MDPLTLLRLPAVITRVGLPKSSIYSLIDRGVFPRPVSYGSGKQRAWIAAELDAFVRARAAERDAASVDSQRRSKT